MLIHQFCVLQRALRAVPGGEEPETRHAGVGAVTLGVVFHSQGMASSIIDDHWLAESCGAVPGGRGPGAAHAGVAGVAQPVGHPF